MATLTVALLPANADALPYKVVACDAADSWGFANNSWTRLGTGTIETRCPTDRERLGMTTRLAGSTFRGFTASAYNFQAPPGATITGFRWSGGLARSNCDWLARITAYPADSTVMGVNPDQQCTTYEFDIGSTIWGFTVPPGTTNLRQVVACGAPSCQSGASFHTRHMVVFLDDHLVPNVGVRGPMAEGFWVGGDEVADTDANDNTGIKRISASLGTGTETYEFNCNETLTVPCPPGVMQPISLPTSKVPDGHHKLTVTATDATGHSTSISPTVRIDNTPPDPIVPSVVGGEAWRTTNEFTLQWANTALQYAPITAAHWEVCLDGRCSQGSRAGENIRELRRVVTTNPGDHIARVWLEDAAGNARKEAAIAAVRLRYDPVAPSLTFAPPDSADPLRVAATVTDRHSGVAGGELEMRRVGTNAWHGLDTALDQGELRAYVDDERFRQGAYEFRAWATDHAGNEASVGPADASASTLRLPVRAGTRLKAGVRRVFVKRRVVGERGRKRTIHRRVVSFDPRVRIKAGRMVTLQGRLTNQEGQPLSEATVEVFEDNSIGTPRLLATIQTSPEGSLAYRFRARRNRVIRFRYGGSRRIAPAESSVRIRVPASSTIRVNRSTLINGESVVFRGRVTTAPIPRTGKLVEIQAHFRDRFRTFSTVRTDRHGRWRYRYRFGGTVGRVRYRFRVLLPAEGGYPFGAGTSKVVRVLVIGL